MSNDTPRPTKLDQLKNRTQSTLTRLQPIVGAVLGTFLAGVLGVILSLYGLLFALGGEGTIDIVVGTAVLAALVGTITATMLHSVVTTITRVSFAGWSPGDRGEFAAYGQTLALPRPSRISRMQSGIVFGGYFGGLTLAAILLAGGSSVITWPLWLILTGSAVLATVSTVVAIGLRSAYRTVV